MPIKALEKMAANILQKELAADFELPHLTLGQFFFHQANQFSNQICQIDGHTGKTETFGSLQKRSVRLALALQKIGFTSKDLIVTYAQNSLDFLMPSLAGAYLGCSVCNLHPGFSKIENGHVLKQIQPAAVFVDLSTLEVMEELLTIAEISPKVVVFEQNEKYTSLEQLIKNCTEEEESFKPAEVDFNETALLLFSSGTSGVPKAICHSHQSILNATYGQGVVSGEDKLLHYIPFYGLSAWQMLLKCYLNGVVQVFCNNLVGNQIFEFIEKYSINILLMAPIYTYQITNCENLSKYNLTSLKSVIISGTSINPEQLQRLRECLPEHMWICVSYGMTECCGTTYLLINIVDKSKWNSVGVLMPGVSLKIRDIITHAALGANQQGEICVKSPYLMKNYYKKIDNVEVFDEDGFYKTGDLGYFDKDGFVYIVDQVNDTFKYKTFPIAVSLIENILLQHPAIKDAAVYGIPQSAEIGKLPAACVILKKDCHATEDEIKDFVAERVVDHDQLRGGVTFLNLPQLPRTPTGKLIKREILRFLNKTFDVVRETARNV